MRQKTSSVFILCVEVCCCYWGYSQLSMITWVTFVGWWMYTSSLFSVDLKSHDWRRKSVAIELYDPAAHAVNKSCYCSTLGHIPHVLIFFSFFFFHVVYFFTELPTLLILCYSLIDFSVSLPAFSENSLQISLNIKILLKKSLFTMPNWISYTTEYVCTCLRCGML